MGLIFNNRPSSGRYMYLSRVIPHPSSYASSIVVENVNKDTSSDDCGNLANTIEDCTNEPQVFEVVKSTNTVSHADGKDNNEQHTLLKSLHRRRCISCYKILSRKFSRKVARNKAPNVKLECLTCGKPYCRSCFEKTHSEHLEDNLTAFNKV